MKNPASPFVLRGFGFCVVLVSPCPQQRASLARDTERTEAQEVKRGHKLFSKFERMNFQWDNGNLVKSWVKHGVSVEETESVWRDKNYKIVMSRMTTADELRFLCIGISNAERLLTIVYTYRSENLIRVISSRPANKKEKEFYHGR